MEIHGFDWDDGNWPKCGKHGVARRYVFLVFMFRKIGGQTKLRPISARFMHQKEIDHYEQKT